MELLPFVLYLCQGIKYFFKSVFNIANYFHSTHPPYFLDCFSNHSSKTLLISSDTDNLFFRDNALNCFI